MSESSISVRKSGCNVRMRMKRDRRIISVRAGWFIDVRTERVGDTNSFRISVLREEGDYDFAGHLKYVFETDEWAAWRHSETEKKAVKFAKSASAIDYIATNY